MEELNYASFEASKRLVSAGIILKTDYVWAGIYGTTVSLENQKWVLIPKSTHNVQIPAPCFTEVWRELPDGTELSKNGLVYASIESDEGFYKEFVSDNPTDALIDLLIWVKEQNRERIVKKLIDHADKLKW